MQTTMEAPAERVVKRRNRVPKKPTGDIPPGRMWHIALVKEACGWGNAALATQRQKGLAVHYTGNRGFVYTDDLIAFLRGQPTVHQAPAD